MNDPGLIASFASGGSKVEPLIEPLLRLLGQRRADIDAIFVKPTTHANRLIPALMKAQREARVI